MSAAGNEHREVDVECANVPIVISPSTDAVRAVPEHHKDPDERKRLERREKHGVDLATSSAGRDDVVGAPPKPRRRGGTGPETLDDADAGDGLLDERRQPPSSSWCIRVRAA